MGLLKWIREVLEKKRLARLRLEREKIIKKALELERDFLSKKLLKSEYKTMHADLKARLTVLDLEIGIADISDNIEKMLNNLDGLDAKNFEKTRVFLKSVEEVENKASNAKNDYDKGRIGLQEFLENLKAAYYEMIDAEHELRNIFKQQEMKNIKEIVEEASQYSTKVKKEKSEQDKKIISDVLLEANSKHKNKPYKRKPNLGKKSG
jgi:hypothetical protein